MFLKTSSWKVYDAPRLGYLVIYASNYREYCLDYLIITSVFAYPAHLVKGLGTSGEGFRDLRSGSGVRRRPALGHMLGPPPKISRLCIPYMLECTRMGIIRAMDRLGGGFQFFFLGERMNSQIP